MIGVGQVSQSADAHASTNGTAALALHMGLPRKYYRGIGQATGSNPLTPNPPVARAARTLKAFNPRKYYRAHTHARARAHIATGGQ